MLLNHVVESASSLLIMTESVIRPATAFPNKLDGLISPFILDFIIFTLLWVYNYINIFT